MFHIFVTCSAGEYCGSVLYKWPSYYYIETDIARPLKTESCHNRNSQDDVYGKKRVQECPLCKNKALFRRTMWTRHVITRTTCDATSDDEIDTPMVFNLRVVVWNESVAFPCSCRGRPSLSRWRFWVGHFCTRHRSFGWLR